MPKIHTKFVCQQCGYATSGWLGKCPNCNSWGSLVEQIVESTSSKSRTKATTSSKPQTLTQVKSLFNKRLLTKSQEFDRVLGGGIVPGSVILIAGEPGIGKSTLLLNLANSISQTGTVLYVSGEESAQQIKLRAERFGIQSKNILLSPETNVDAIISQINEIKPDLVIIDSIQTLTTEDLTGVAGSVGQVRESASRLADTVKSLNIPLFLIGHVTKEGTIAGPRVLEHLVDVVLYLEGERFHNLRILRGVKNRFGATDEVGIFSMEEKGLLDITNPGLIFLSDNKKAVPGSVVVVAAEGSRPMLVEVQALVSPSNLVNPRRVANGIDFNRLQMLVAIIVKHLRLPLNNFDVYVNVASGFKIREPASDLGVCLAIISSFKNKAITKNSVAIGEVGLLGEIRKVPSQEKRAKEARQLGYKSILSYLTGNLPKLYNSLF